MANNLNRRLELLRLESLGFSRSQVVKRLSEKMGVSPRTIWRDYAIRASWQPLLTEMKAEEALLKTLNRDEFIYGQCVLMYIRAKTDLAKLTALGYMLKANEAIFEKAVMPEFMDQLETRLEVLEKPKWRA